MRCEDVLEQLTAFSSGELPTDSRQAVQAHLAGCAACRTALVRVDALAGVLAGAKTPPMPLGLASRVMATARQRQEAEPVAAWDLMRWWRLTSAPTRFAAAAVLVVGLTVGLVMGWTAAPSTGQALAEAQADPLAVYHVGYLSDAPEGSIAESYLTLALGRNGEGR